MTSTRSDSVRVLIAFIAVLPFVYLFGQVLHDPKGAQLSLLVGCAIAILWIPSVLKWQHAFLIFSWNAWLRLFFLPGSPELWMLMAFLSLAIAIVHRSLMKDVRFLSAPSVTIPILVIGFVVIYTAWERGFGLMSFGGSVAGGRGYFVIIASLAGYFAVIAQRTPEDRAGIYLALFFLSALTKAIGTIIAHLIPYFGESLAYFAYLFPVVTTDVGTVLTNPEASGTGVNRFWGLSVAFMGVFYYVLARFGVRGSVSFRTPWRFALVALMLALTAASGYRSYFLLLCLILVLLLYFEGLLRSKYAVGLLLAGIVGFALLIPFASRLPLPIQRTLSILPLDIDPVARANAETSTEWRWTMWKRLWEEQMPNYLFLGKGLAMDVAELQLASDLAEHGAVSSQELMMVSGAYHSGPLTVLIPFGISGALAWTWFLAAGWRALRRNYLHGDPTLKKVNTFLLAWFTAKIIHYIVIFGDFQTDVPLFFAIVAFSITLNGGIRGGPREHAVVQPMTMPNRNLVRRFAGVVPHGGSTRA